MIPGETVRSQHEMDCPKNPHYSEFKILSSAAGYYIGTMFLACGEQNCKDCKEYMFGDGALVKGQELDYNSRETGYFKTWKEASDALEEYKKSGTLPGERY